MEPYSVRRTWVGSARLVEGPPSEALSRPEVASTASRHASISTRRSIVGAKDWHERGGRRIARAIPVGGGVRSSRGATPELAVSFGGLRGRQLGVFGNRRLLRQVFLSLFRRKHLWYVLGQDGVG